MKKLKPSEMFVLLLVLAIGVGGAIVAVVVVNSIGSSAGAKVRLVDHHCTRGRSGSELVNAQLANDAQTGAVQASGYVLLAGGRIVNANGWQYEKSIAGGSSEFFTGSVPVHAGQHVIGCGVLLGSGAPNGVSYVGDHG